MLQLLKPVCREPVLCKRSHCNEKLVCCKEESPPLAAMREKPSQQQRPSTVKNKEINIKKNSIFFKKKGCLVNEGLNVEWNLSFVEVEV